MHCYGGQTDGKNIQHVHVVNAFKYVSTITMGLVKKNIFNILNED